MQNQKACLLGQKEAREIVLQRRAGSRRGPGPVGQDLEAMPRTFPFSWALQIEGRNCGRRWRDEWEATGKRLIRSHQAG
jgi:hypothetical protein